MSPGGFVLLVVVSLAICVQCLPVEPKFKQMALQAEESQTNTEIEAISARITFLQKLNKLTYDTTLFTRKLRWLLRRSLTEKPSVAQVADLMAKELEISKAQIDLAVEGVADELTLEVKQGIIALKAGLAFIKDNYKAGSDPQADAIIAHIEANLASLEARFGQKTGMSVGTGGTGGSLLTSESSTTEAPLPAVSSTAVPSPAVSSTAVPPPAVEQSSAAAPTPTSAVSSTPQPPTPVAQSTTLAPPSPSAASTGPGSLIGGTPSVAATAATTTPAESSTTQTSPTPAVSTASPTPAASTAAALPPTVAALPPTVTFQSTGGFFNATNSTSSTSGFTAASPLSTSTAGF